jgi:hypothetical protein
VLLHIDATGTGALAGGRITDLLSRVNQRAPDNISSTMKRFRPRRASKSPMIDLKMQPTSLASGRPILTAIKVSIPNRNTFFEPSD